MVLYYGLLALETANNSAAAATVPKIKATKTMAGIASDQTSLPRKQKYLSNSIGKIPSSSLSSSNSWIYTEDLRKRFEERYADYRYVLIPVYIDRKSTAHSLSTTAILSANDRENSWMYSRSLRDHLFYSTSKMSLPLTTNRSSSASCVTNHGFMRDELPIKKTLKSRFFKRSSSTRDKTANSNLSLPSLPFSPFNSSVSPFSTNNLVKHRTSDVVEEEDDEGVVDENHSAPLIKHDSIEPSSLSTSRTIPISSTSNNTMISPTTANVLASSTATSSNAIPSIKRPAKQNNKLTRLRSFFFKSFSPSSSFYRTQQKQQQQQQQQTTLSSSSLSNRISRT